MKAAVNALEKVLAFLEPLMPLANCHMVDFFTNRLYEEHVSYEVREEIDVLGFRRAFDVVWSDGTSSGISGALENYLSLCKEHTLKKLPEVCMVLADFQLELKQMGCRNLDGLHLKVFMSSKKSHEVQVMSEIVAAVGDIARTTHVIDAGDGKGYLSSMLSLHNGLKVLGVDSSDVNTKNAEKRAGKLGRAWKGLTGKQLSQAGNLYRRTTQFLTGNEDLRTLAEDRFQESCPALTVVGLHTCGNLAPTCVKIFDRDDNVKALCNVGCCYHLLDESQSSADGFPMSDHLKRKHFELGRNARMLAAQSLDRILSRKELPNETLFHRALLQVMIMRHFPELRDRHVGKFSQQCPSFCHYVRSAFSKMNTECTLSDSDIHTFGETHSDKRSALEMFYLLRAHLAPVIETVVLLDRLLFLKERGYRNSYLVDMFQAVISPRCYGLVAFKNECFDI